MENFLNSRKLILGFGILAVIVVAAILYRTRPTTSADNQVVSADVAVSRALESAAGSADEIRGQVMTYDQSHSFIFGRPVAPNTERAKMAANRVWLVVLHGNFIEHVPAAPGPIPIPEKIVLHHQMAIIMDAVTTDAFEMALVSPNKPLDVSTLALLTLPAEPVVGIPTRLPILTDAPLPTLPPAP